MPLCSSNYNNRITIYCSAACHCLGTSHWELCNVATTQQTERKRLAEGDRCWRFRTGAMQKVANAAAAAVPQCARAGAELALQVLIKCDQRWRHTALLSWLQLAMTNYNLTPQTLHHHYHHHHHQFSLTFVDRFQLSPLCKYSRIFLHCRLWNSAVMERIN